MLTDRNKDVKKELVPLFIPARGTPAMAIE